MTWAVYLPFIAALVLVWASAGFARRIAPGLGALALTITTLLSAGSQLWALALLTVSLLDDLPTGLADDAVPVPDAVSLCAAGLLAIAGVRLVGTYLRQRRLRRQLHRSLASATTELVVIPHTLAQAFAVPGRPARIVVTDQMLRLLGPDRCRVLIAHERAHLAYRHSWALNLCQLAAAANPLLRPAYTAIAYLCERQADERAAIVVGDRGAVADAIASAARSRSAAQPPLAFHRLGVVDRVAALVEPDQRRRSAVLAGALALAVGELVASCLATSDLLELLTSVGR